MRLGTRLLWPLLSVVGVMMIAYGATAAARRERTLLSDAGRETDAYATALGIAIQYAFSDGDLTDLEQILERIAAEPKIYGVIVYNGSGQGIAAAEPLTMADTLPATHVRERLSKVNPAPVQRTLHDERFHSVFRAIRSSSGEVVGGLEVLQPLSPIFLELERSRVRVVVAGLALLLGVAIMLLWLVRHVIARPLQQLVSGARALGSGELAYRIEEHGATELAELSVEFNRMATHLQSAQNNLLREAEDRVALERQLRHAEKLAEVGNLAAGLAHEIAAPLNVVAGRAEMLRRGDKPHETRERDLRIIIDQIGRITVIVRNLLDFAKRREPRLQRAAVDALLSGVLELVEGELERAHVIVQREWQAGLELIGDPELLHQVMMNLLMNAIQSVEQIETERHIKVGAHKRGSMLAIEVTDNGVGIPADVRARLFEPFFTTKPPGRGTGLGLAVVRNIVEEHGGVVEVDTAEGGVSQGGATFRVLLPAADNAND